MSSRADDNVSYVYWLLIVVLMSVGGKLLMGFTSWLPTTPYTKVKLELVMFPYALSRSLTTSALVTSHSAPSTTSPVKSVNAALGAISFMAEYKLSSRSNGESQLWFPYGPAGYEVFPGASAAVYGRQQILSLQL